MRIGRFAVFDLGDAGLHGAQHVQKLGNYDLKTIKQGMEKVNESIIDMFNDC